MFPAISLIVTCLTVNVCGLSHLPIIGGKDAEDGKYPYQASLRYTPNEHFCGGAIIDERYIVTAAHCLDIFKDASDFFVVVGSNYLDPPGAKYEVENFTIHENYNSIPPYNDDIGLIRVSTDIEFNSNTSPINISSTDRDYNENSLIIATGWGLIEDGNKNVPNRLQIIELKGYPRQKCIKFFKSSIMNSQLCTCNKKDEGVCNGDSGGPLVIEDDWSRYLIGLVSCSLNPCANGTPEVHTRVFSYKSWIERTINLETDEDVGIHRDYAGGSNTIQPNVILGFFVIYLCIRSIL